MTTSSICNDCRYSPRDTGDDAKPCYTCAGGSMAKRSATPPIRAGLLQEALRLTTADRNDQYGDPLINTACAGELKEVFRKYHKLSGRRTIGHGEQEALDMVFTKLSRIAAGGDVKPDTYIDAAAYFAMAGECAQREAAGELKDG